MINDGPLKTTPTMNTSLRLRPPDKLRTLFLKVKILSIAD